LRYWNHVAATGSKKKALRTGHLEKSKEGGNGTQMGDVSRIDADVGAGKQKDDWETSRKGTVRKPLKYK